MHLTLRPVFQVPHPRPLTYLFNLLHVATLCLFSIHRQLLLILSFPLSSIKHFYFMNNFRKFATITFPPKLFL